MEKVKCLDESSFTFFPTSVQVYIWREPKDALKAQCLPPAGKHSSGSVMVSTGISIHSRNMRPFYTTQHCKHHSLIMSPYSKMIMPPFKLLNKFKRGFMNSRMRSNLHSFCTRSKLVVQPLRWADFPPSEKLYAFLLEKMSITCFFPSLLQFFFLFSWGLVTKITIHTVQDFKKRWSSCGGKGCSSPYYVTDVRILSGVSVTLPCGLDIIIQHVFSARQSNWSNTCLMVGHTLLVAMPTLLETKELVNDLSCFLLFFLYTPLRKTFQTVYMGGNKCVIMSIKSYMSHITLENIFHCNYG